MLMQFCFFVQIIVVVEIKLACRDFPKSRGCILCFLPDRAVQQYQAIVRKQADYCLREQD